MPSEKLTHKKCTKCGEIKSIDCFFERKDRPIGYRADCKKCNNKQTVAIRQRDPEKRNAYMREFRRRNPDLIRKYRKEWREKNPEKAKEISKRARDKQLSKPRGKLNYSMSRRIYKGLKYTKGNRSWKEFVGYTVDELKKHP